MDVRFYAGRSAPGAKKCGRRAPCHGGAQGLFERSRIEPLQKNGAAALYSRRVIPDALHWLFWDVDPTTIELAARADYVLERVMARGDWAAMRWLLRTYDREARADFLTRRGDRLAARERAFWCLVSGVPNAASAGGARPPWVGRRDD